jgi:hypothetical protein
MTDNLYQSPELGPRFGPTLCEFCERFLSERAVEIESTGPQGSAGLAGLGALDIILTDETIP